MKSSFLTKTKKLFEPVDLTKGKPYKQILIFMLPIFISYIFQQIYTLTDAIIVGQSLTASEVNGINDVGSLTYIVLQFAFGCSAGFSVISSTKQGKHDPDGVRKSFLAQIILCVIISIILTIISVALIDPMLSLVNLSAATGGATYEAAKTYILIIFLGTICQVAYNQVCSLLRSIGDSITPLLFLIASSVLHIALACLFIMVFHMGVAGAGIATIISQGVSAALCYIYSFIKYPFLRFKKEDFNLGWKFYFEHLKLGIPLALQYSILGIGLITLQSTIVKFDTTLSGVVLDSGPAQLAYGASNKVQTFLMTPLNALGTAMLSFCGQNLGARYITRIKKGLKASIILLMIMYVFLLSLLCTVPFFPLVGTLYIMRCSLQGLEKPIIPFVGGIAELLARTLTCLFAPLAFCNQISAELDLYSNPGPFIMTCMADPIAWLSAVIVLVGGFILSLKSLNKLENKEELTLGEKETN